MSSWSTFRFFLRRLKSYRLPANIQSQKMSQQRDDSGPKGTEEETASLLQWLYSKLAGRITGSGEGDI